MTDQVVIVTGSGQGIGVRRREGRNRLIDAKHGSGFCSPKYPHQRCRTRLFDTPLLRGFAEAAGDTEGAIQQWCSRIPIRQLQQPAEVAEVILFLASSRASAVTGVTYPVDGGILTAQPFMRD